MVEGAGARQPRRRAGGCGRRGGEWALAAVWLGAGSAAAARWSQGPEVEADDCSMSADAGSGRDPGADARVPSKLAAYGCDTDS
jgi:hypothetical protein